MQNCGYRVLSIISTLKGDPIKFCIAYLEAILVKVENKSTLLSRGAGDVYFFKSIPYKKI
jgi:hypothetical protein